MKKFRNWNNTVHFLIAFGIANIFYFVICFMAFHMFVNFSGLFLILGAASILLGILKGRFYKNKLNKFTRRLYKTIKVFIYIFTASFIFIEACIFINANLGVYKKPDYIMILGAGLRGKNMLLVQFQRAQEALKYIKENPDIKVIASGGQGPGEDISEAEALRIYLVQNGVKNENIIKEEKSKTTAENMKYTSEILRNIDGRKNIRLAIVTSNFHVFRAKFLAERFGFDAEGISAPVNYLLLPNYCVREYFAVIKSAIFDK